MHPTPAAWSCGGVQGSCGVEELLCSGGPCETPPKGAAAQGVLLFQQDVFCVVNHSVFVLLPV